MQEIIPIHFLVIYDENLSKMICALDKASNFLCSMNS